jgi:hypothetical protein
LSYGVDGGFWGDSRSETVINGYNLNQDFVVIPPHGVVVIEVSVMIYHDVSDGHVLADFASEAYRITNHYVQVALLSAPALTTTPTAPSGMYG